MNERSIDRAVSWEPVGDPAAGHWRLPMFCVTEQFGVMYPAE